MYFYQKKINQTRKKGNETTEEKSGIIFIEMRGVTDKHGGGLKETGKSWKNERKIWEKKGEDIKKASVTPLHNKISG